jgi:hypothetical protein
MTSTVTRYDETTVTVAPPAVTIPSNIIVNGNFESFLTTANKLPWTDIQGGSGGRIEIINGVNPCTTGGAYCAGGSVVLRSFPPTSGGGSVGIQQTFVGRPSTTYNVSFMYRCLNYDGSSKIEVRYAGNVIGVANSCINSSAFSRASGMQFTTDATGRGELQVRWVNPTNMQYLYFYTDDFKAIAAA